ncbi:ABC transporter ATP-binding protein [Desulfococcus sp.]|uniref:ABC transporter ATP-binding protein n=1 Tax=Desulfococcus sp. TaxID=2025834 RepID=UPI003593B06C
MAADIAIRTEALGKCYHLYSEPMDRLKQSIFRSRRQYFREFWALRDVSFDIGRGETFGIIGANGSGKSTLLQMICGTLQPTEGELSVNGRISALLELGAGFNTEFTGRENVYLNAAILGLSREETDEKYPKILEFADIGDFINRPVKTYSTGMLVRLAFSVQVAVDPDILIIDEALSVGDIFFQQKCMRRMKALREQGVTILFVSHDLTLVRDFCGRVLYLKHGRMKCLGQSQQAIQRFIQEDHRPEPAAGEKAAPAAERSAPDDDVLAFKENAVWVRDGAPETSAGTGDGKARILAVSVLNSENEMTLAARIGEKLRIRVLYQVFAEEEFHVTVVMKNRYDQIIFSGGSYTLGMEIPRLAPGEMTVFEMQATAMIEAGLYTFAVKLGQRIGSRNKGVEIDATPWLGPIGITWDYENQVAPFFGMFGIPSEGRFMNVKEMP